MRSKERHGQLRKPLGKILETIFNSHFGSVILVSFYEFKLNQQEILHSQINLKILIISFELLGISCDLNGICQIFNGFPLFFCSHIFSADVCGYFEMNSIQFVMDCLWRRIKTFVFFAQIWRCHRLP